MNREFITHWIVGVLCTLIWFWGDKVGIPSDGITLASSVVPAALADAMRKSSADVRNKDPMPDQPELFKPKKTQIGVTDK